MVAVLALALALAARRIHSLFWAVNVAALNVRSGGRVVLPG
ncbi:MAG: hypothetical protein QXI60_02485 [Thermofilaceae archaeon]